MDHFDEVELKHVAFELAINWDDIPGDRLSAKAHSLITQSDRSGKIDELVAALSRERSHVNWTGILEPNAPSPPVEEDSVRTAVWNALYRSLWTKKTFLNSYKGRPPLIDKFSVSVWADFFNRPIDSRPREPVSILEEIRAYFFACQDEEFYRYLEFILNYWNTLNHYKPDPINRMVNTALNSQKTGRQYRPTYEYRHFVSGAIVQEEE